MYLGRHNKGETYILMLRFKAEPDIPYITVEIDAKIRGLYSGTEIRIRSRMKRIFRAGWLPG